MFGGHRSGRYRIYNMTHAVDRARQGRKRGRLCDRAIVRGLDFDYGSCRGSCRGGGGGCTLVLCRTVILFMRLCSPWLVICSAELLIMQHAQVVHRSIDIRVHPSDSSFYPYAFKIIGTHTDKSLPRTRLAKDLIVRKCSEVRSKPCNCWIRGV